MQTHQQQYANLAWDRVAARKGHPIAADYKRQADRFPALVLQSGLAQALGFLLAKDTDAHHAYLADLCAVLSEVHGGAADAQGRASEIVQADVIAYQRHTRQCLAAAVWFKRLAETELKSKTTADHSKPHNASDTTHATNATNTGEAP